MNVNSSRGDYPAMFCGGGIRQVPTGAVTRSTRARLMRPKVGLPCEY